MQIYRQSSILCYHIIIIIIIIVDCFLCVCWCMTHNKKQYLYKCVDHIQNLKGIEIGVSLPHPH